MKKQLNACLEDYLDKSGKAMFAACITFDSARSAEKMEEWHCIGEDNDAWKKGPYLSAPANAKQLDRSHPYVMKTSEEFMMVAEIIMGPNPKKSENGGVKLPLPPKDKYDSHVEPVISKLAIIEQFELFKEFLIVFDGPYNKKKRTDWVDRVSEDILSDVAELTDRRNELTHDSSYRLPSMQEAVDYFYNLRLLAPELYRKK